MGNRFIRMALLGLVAWAALAGVATAAGDQLGGKKAAAVAAAREWLALVDAGKYPDSWDAAAELFRDSVPKGQWAQQLGGARAPLGKVVKRELRSRSYRTALPGAPDGEYVVLEYTTSFTGKKGAVETVTPALDRDGTWRVSGYYIR